MTQREQLTAKIAETRLAIAKQMAVLRDLIYDEEWDLASYVAADNLKESLLLMTMRTKQLAELEDE